MSKTVWAAGLSLCIAIAIQFAPIPDAWRWGITVVAIIGIVICIGGWFFAHHKEKNGENRSVNILGQISGTVGVAVRDNVGSIHHYHSGHPHPQPLGARVDAWALRDIKVHRDDGEKLLREIQPGDGESGSKWGQIDNWWIEANEKAQRNVFSPFLTLGDLTRFKEPWEEGDKTRACAMAVDAGQINDTKDDVSLYQTHWERLERLRQLIGGIESKG